MSKNSNLCKARKAKNDEFYTQLSDIENELKHYTKHFKDKIVYCNCDDPTWSNFFKYFYLNMKSLGIKRLITTHYNKDNSPSYRLDVVNNEEMPQLTEFDSAKDLSEDKNDQKAQPCYRTNLKGNGDFRSDECIEILKEADVVVSNPPFSLFLNYVAQLIEHDKKFLIIGNINSIACKEIFPLIKENKMWLGYNHCKTFKQPDGTFKKFGNICWFSNLDIDKRHEKLDFYKKYKDHENEFPKYDNYDAINIDKVSNIPEDYFDIMGVPITFVDKFNPDQFEILGQMANTKNDANNYGYPFINKERKYARILIQRKKETDHENEFPKYDNYDAINVDKVSDIPEDYYGVMGVPITYLAKHNPDQFEILGKTGDIEWAENECYFFNPPSKEKAEKYKKSDSTWRIQNPYFILQNEKVKTLYCRIFIKRKKEE